MLNATTKHTDDGSVELVNDGNNDRWRVEVEGYGDADPDVDAGAGDDGEIDNARGYRGQPIEEDREIDELKGVAESAEEEDPSDEEMNELGEDESHRFGGYEDDDY